MNVGTGTGATTDDNGIKLLPRGGTQGLIVRGDGFIAHVPAALTVTTEANMPDPLTSSIYLITGDNDTDNDAIDLQDGDVAGQLLKIAAVALVDADDTITINMADTTCTNCGAVVLSTIGENVDMFWTGSTWIITSIMDAL